MVEVWPKHYSGPKSKDGGIGNTGSCVHFPFPGIPVEFRRVAQWQSTVLSP